MSRTTVVRICAVVLNLAVIASVIALVRYSDQPQVRHEDCTYELVYGREGPAGVMVLGTSRTGRGIEASTLEAEIRSRIDLDNATSVVLFRPGNGMDDIPELVRDVTGNLGVDTILAVEYSIRAQPLYQSAGRNFAVKSSSGEIIDQFNSSDEPIDGLARDVLARFATKLTLAVNHVVEGELAPAWEGPLLPTETAQARDLCTRLEGEARPRPGQLAALENDVAKRWGDWTGKPLRFFDLERTDYQRLDYLTKATVADAQAAGVPIVFFRVPAYLEAPVDPGFAEEFEQRYGAKLLLAPAELLETLYRRELYRNVGHVGAEGREIYSEWLGKAIAGHLAQDD
jgi:hypothetical protein